MIYNLEVEHERLFRMERNQLGLPRTTTTKKQLDDYRKHCAIVISARAFRYNNHKSAEFEIGKIIDEGYTTYKRQGTMLILQNAEGCETKLRWRAEIDYYLLCISILRSENG